MTNATQLFNQLCIRLIKQGLNDQIGIVVQADELFNNEKFVVFADGDKLKILQLEDQTIEEFSTVSYGTLN